MSIFQPFSSLPLPEHRFLYDEAFLDSECNPTIFEEGGVELSTVDNTVGTWSTNYAILAIGLLGTFKFSCMMEPIAQRWLWTSGYFLFTGLGFGVAGVNHQIQKLKTDPNFDYVALILTTLGALSLQYQISIHITGDKIRQLYTMFVSLLELGVIMAVIGWSLNEVAAGYLIASNLWFMLYYGIQKDWAVTLGCLFMLVGSAVQLALAPTCGDKGYADCFQDCILPNPRVFNHNAVFHVLVIIGLVVHLFARFVPSESSPNNEDADQEDKQHKASDDAEAEEEEEVPPDPVSSA